MVIMLQENKKKTVGQKLNAGAGRGLEMGAKLMGEYQKKQEQKQLQELQAQQYQEENEAAKRLGVDISGIRDPKIRQETVANALKGKIDQESQQRKFAHDIEKQTAQQYFEGTQKQNELANKKPTKEETEAGQNISNLNSALETVNRMRKIRKGGNLGRGSAITGFFGGQIAKDRGEYETLGNSLIQYASNIPIRNKAEFEKLAGRLSDPSITDDEAEGILDAMESIIQHSMQQYQGNESPQMRGPAPSNKPSSVGKPLLKSFLR